MPAHVAAASGNVAALEVLLELGTPPRARDRERQSLLHYAARAGSLVAVQLVVRYGAEVSARDRQLRTALHWAALGGDADVAEALVAARAELEPPKVSASVHRRATRLPQESPLELALRKHPADARLHAVLGQSAALAAES